MSIGKAQAAAIADGFLDSLGSDPGSFEPKETFTELILLAGGLVEQAQNNLNNSNSNASGKGSASIIANEPEMAGTALKIDITMNYYLKFVNKGVKGTKGGTGLYAFKYDKPSQKMVDSIREWSKLGKLSTSNTNASKSTSRNERKNASIGSLDNSYAVARSIKQKGIKGNGFMDKTIITTQQKVGDTLGAALKVDIINSIT